MQRPDFLGEKNKPGQRSCIFKKLLFSLSVSDINNVAKLVGDMWGNCFNRLSVIVQLNSNEHDFQKQPFTDVLQSRCS